MGRKGILSDFEHVMVVNTTQASMSVSENADLLGFNKVYREWFKKEKISSEWQLCGRKCPLM